MKDTRWLFSWIVLTAMSLVVTVILISLPVPGTAVSTIHMVQIWELIFNATGIGCLAVFLWRLVSRS
jgi:hypothetical protein